MLLKILCVLFFCGILVFVKLGNSEQEVCNTNCATLNRSESNGTNSQVLSRRKRYLLFPDGSSFQLVFCVQTAAEIPIGDIFLYGNTAALAWQLPTDPKTFFLFKEYQKTDLRRNDDTYDDNDEGKIVSKFSPERSTINKPIFSKRSTDEKRTYKERLKIKIDRTKMHQRQSKRDFLKKDDLDVDSIEFHRHSRLGLYEKLVPFITALGGDGKQCVLYKLCETAKISRQGTFLQEILRVVFTLPKGKEFEEQHRHYDKAHNPSDSCASLYPCDIAIPTQLKA
ncbi:unnamed protein product [Euphydryas editha]|uniref:Uncharacterized protein n=1 Tax=Euphydryas editha TaxID=104508 RepID=A0AAU9TL79_EUPED|nr:unnamed protein product [Euphydryas editha]